jgi:hypothetical protein
LYNHQFPQSALKSKTPMQTMKDWYATHPHLFNKRPYDRPGCNSYRVDDANVYLGQHFSLVPREYDSIEAAFKDLKDKGSFGAILVHQNLLQDADFERLYQTDHACACYWLSLLRKHERGEELKIIVPDFPCVALRAGRKTYNQIDVYFNTIPRWMAVHQQLLQTSGLRRLFDEFAAEMARRNTSLRFLIGLRGTGCDLHSIQKADLAFYDRHRLRIWLAQRLGTSFFYKGLRLYLGLIRKSIRKLRHVEGQISATHITYKLSSAMVQAR